MPSWGGTLPGWSPYGAGVSVGKTRLLAEWCLAHEGVYTVADLSAEPVQRRYFAEAIAQRLPGFKEVEYPDWPALLRRPEHRLAG